MALIYSPVEMVWIEPDNVGASAGGSGKGKLLLRFLLLSNFSDKRSFCTIICKFIYSVLCLLVTMFAAIIILTFVFYFK